MANPIAVRIREHLADRRDEIKEFLLGLVEAESPTLDPTSQAGPQRRLAARLEGAGFDVRRVPGRVSGGTLLARPRGRERGRPVQVLLGHSDTVWPLGTIREMPPHVSNGRLFGPGAFDMKGGLVQIVFALEALRALDLAPVVTPVVLVNSDEEIGSPDSWSTIERLARVADRAFVLEPALGPTGKLKTARKGFGQFQVQVFGRAAHAGLEPEKGASAIVELSHLIQRLSALNDPERGVTVNVGTIDGGLRTNMIAPLSYASIDVRILHAEDAPLVERAILTLEPTTPGTRLEVRGGISRLPLERTRRNRRLWRLAQRAAYDLGLEIDEGISGGGSDGNITSLHCATLDGLGPVGDGAHAAHENVLLESLPERTALLAVLLLEPALARKRAAVAPVAGSAPPPDSGVAAGAEGAKGGGLTPPRRPHAS
ncbi:MAG: M20 family metallopeptidase [Gemmatimonadota bacterium]